MAYEVTATRRRPQQFENLAGQEFVAETLKNSIKTGQIAHAYLFTGPRGCGKTSSARILAKSLNCQNSSGPTCEPCGQCESCKAITNSSSLDVIEIDGASNTSINDVRQIKDEIMFPPTSSRYKIYIIDEVHMLSDSAFNALLKTIEEPPAHVVFIFATTELQEVPATIKSRCQQYNFRLVSVEKLKELLSEACREMNIQADDEALYWIAKESGGSVRDCYTLFDQVVAFSQNQITYDKIKDKLGLLGVDRLNSIFEACVDSNSQEVMNQLDQYLQMGISIEQLISNSSEYLRSLLLLKNGITKESLLGQSPDRYSQKVLSSWNTIQTERAISIFLQLYRDIRYSLSPRYELELAFSRLCWLTQYVSPSEVKAAIDKAQALLQGAPVSSQSQNTTPLTAPQKNFASQPQEPVSQPQNTAPVSENQAVSPAQTSQERPSGMPIFSALMKNSPAPQSSGQEEANPFPNGGALPPENTAASTTSHSSSIDYSLDPDDWSNTAAPDESYSPEEEYELQQEYADSVDEDYSDSESSAPDVHVTGEKFTTAQGQQFLIEDVYKKVISELSVSNPLLGSALMQTNSWKVNGSTISTSISSEYQKNMISQNCQQISSIISSFCSSKIDFQIEQIKEETVAQKSVELPEQVKILCKTFKGNVIGGQN